MLRKIIRLLDGIGKKQEELAGERKKAQMERRRPERVKRPGRGIKTVAAAIAVVAVVCLAFTGCRGEKESDTKLENLEFTVVGEKDTPSELQKIIGQKKSNPFKLTYADGQDMYIVIGEGPQEGGGFSITVKELYRTENSVVIKTELLGPETGESGGTEASYPVLIVKCTYFEVPVVFR